MIAKAKLELNKDYYSKYYDDWVKNRSKFRRFSFISGLLFIVIGLIICFQIEKSFNVGLVLSFIGIIQCIDSLTYKMRWINNRVKSGASKKAEFTFFNDRLEIKSDNSKGHILLSGILEVTETQNGIFLYPQKGLSFYIPWTTIEPNEAVDTVKILLTKTEQKH